MSCYCTNTTLQKDIAEGVLEAPFQDYTCYKDGSNYIVKKTEYISNPTSSVYCYWSGTTLTSGSSWTSLVANTVSQMDREIYTKNNFYVRPKIEGAIHKLDPKFIQAKTINGENIYTTKKNSRDMKVVNSVNGQTGYVNISAEVNGENIIERSIDVRGNWNENYTGDTNYIYNRPFYQEDPTYGDPIYLFKGTDYRECRCTDTTLQKDIAEGVLEAPFQDYTCYKEGNNYIVKRTEDISNPPSSAYGYWSGTTLTSGSSWESLVTNISSSDDYWNHAQNNFYVRPKTEGVIHKLDNKFIQAKTINGESVLGEGEIDMSSYQTKTEAVKIARMTQAEYDALSTKDENTLYIIITES